MSFIAEVTNISNFSVMALISGHWAFSENAQISTLILNNAITETACQLLWLESDAGTQTTN